MSERASEPRNRSHRCCHCQRLMNDIYKPEETLLRIQDGYRHPEGSRGNPVITFLSHPALAAATRAGTLRELFPLSLSLSPFTVIVVRPRRIADGTLFQEPSGVSWIVLEHLPDVRKSCHSSGNCKPRPRGAPRLSP